MNTAVKLTIFSSMSATTKKEAIWTPEELVSRIQSTTAARKDLLPWLKLATFGDQKSAKGSFRYDANMTAIAGVEGDYDGEMIPLDIVLETASIAGLFVIVYTSPSHTEAKPRWRILAPTSKPLPPAQRDKLMARLNGLYGGIFAPESWTLSQSYYYGSVNSNPDHRVEVINGTPIDELSELDECWQGKELIQTGINSSAALLSAVRDNSTSNTPRSRVPLSKYGEAALDDALHQIITAPAGQQRSTLNRETYCIAGLCAAGHVPSDLALKWLHRAAEQMKSFDARRPWYRAKLQKIVDDAFVAGLRHPRVQTA